MLPNILCMPFRPGIRKPLALPSCDSCAPLYIGTASCSSVARIENCGAWVQPYQTVNRKSDDLSRKVPLLDLRASSPNRPRLMSNKEIIELTEIVRPLLLLHSRSQQVLCTCDAEEVREEPVAPRLLQVQSCILCALTFIRCYV